MRRFKGGGSSAPTRQEIIQSDLPAYAEPFFGDLLDRASAESQQGYTPFGGQRLAEFGPDETIAQGMTRGFARRGTSPQLTAASDVLMGVDPSTGINFRDFTSDVQAGQFMRGPSQYQSRFNVGPYQRLGFEEGVSRFMSPYQQQVTDIAKREAIRDSEIRGQGIESQATQSGGLGGYREAILQAERERNLGQRLDDIQTRGSAEAFKMAQQQLAAERDLGFRESALEEQLRQRQEDLAQRGQLADIQAGKLGLSAEQIDLGAGRLGLQADDAEARQALALSRGLIGAGQAIDQDALTRIGALSRLGEQERAMRQAGLDIGYGDFERQRDFTKDQLGFLSNILRGVPIQPDRTVSTFQQQPGIFQSALGSGLAGLGLYRATQGQV